MKISLTLTHRKRLAFSNFKQHALASTTFSPSRTKENCPWWHTHVETLPVSENLLQLMREEELNRTRLKRSCTLQFNGYIFTTTRRKVAFARRTKSHWILNLQHGRKTPLDGSHWLLTVQIGDRWNERIHFRVQICYNRLLPSPIHVINIKWNYTRRTENGTGKVFRRLNNP